MSAERSNLVVLLLVVLLGAAIRLSHLDNRPLWSDEVKTLHRAGLELPALVEDLRKSTHPPLYFWVLGKWTRMSGLDAISLRCFSALMGILAIPAVYAFATAWAGPQVGRTAALVIAISPFHIYYSEEARSYAMLALLVLGSMASLLGFAAGRRGAAFGYVACTTAALYTHYWAIFLVLFQNLYVLARFAGRDRGRLPSWIALQVSITLLFLPWLPQIFTQLANGKGDWIEPTGWMVIPKSLYRFSAGYWADRKFPWYRMLALVPFLSIHVPLLAIGSSPRSGESEREREWRIVLVLWLFVPLAIAFAASMFIKPLYAIGRYDMIVFPAFVLLVASGLARLGPALRSAAVGGMVAASTCYLYAHWILRHH